MKFKDDSSSAPHIAPVEARPHGALGGEPELRGSVPLIQKGGWLRRFLAFAGPGYLVSVGYMDPGHWATDIAGGAGFGYALLWVILASNLMAILLQTANAA